MSSKYTVFECENDSILYAGDSQKKALTTWIENARKYYTTITITASTREDELELMNYFMDNKSKFVRKLKEHQVPYDVDYIVNGVTDNINGKSQIQWSGDQTFPFCYG